MQSEALPSDAGRRKLGPAQAHVAVWFVVALSNSVAIAFLPMPAKASARLLHHGFDFFQMAAAALLGLIVIHAWHRFLPKRRWLAVLALGFLSLVVAGWTLVPDFDNWSQRIKQPWLAYLAAVVASQSVTAALVVGRFFAVGWRRLVAAALGLGVLLANHVLLPGDYPGLHFYWVWSATTFAAAALVGTELPRAVERVLSPGLRWSIAGGVALVGALASLVVWPPPVVVSQAFQVTGSVMFPFLAKLRSGSPSKENFDDDRTSSRWVSSRWLKPRDNLKPIPASKPRLTPEKPLVILLVLDALRADVATKLRKAGRFPNIERLAGESVEFTNARSPGAGTRHTMAAIFTGKYASQLKWNSKKGVSDKSPRLTQYLDDAGLTTVHVAVTQTIEKGSGVLGRFDREIRAWPTRASQPLSDDVLPLALQEIERSLADPTFVYLHWLDAHFPYDSQGAGGSRREEQMREAEACDRNFGVLRKKLEELGAWDRTVLILTADHGEGFGEHGVYHHGNALYEELVRVPLMIRVPGVKPARIDVPVSGIDIGPTLLDLMGEKTPARFMGQSLVPFLRGKRPELDRPIAGDARTAQSLVLGRYKIIDDRRRHSVELYDLSQDPEEKNNLFGTLGGDDELMLKALHHFFSVRSTPGQVARFRKGDRQARKER